MSASVRSVLGVDGGGQEKVPFKAPGLLGSQEHLRRCAAKGATPVLAAGGFVLGAGKCLLLMNTVCFSLSSCKLPSAGRKQHFPL